MCPDKDTIQCRACAWNSISTNFRHAAAVKPFEWNCSCKENMRKIKLGILGCGAIAQYAHLPAARKSQHVSLNAICDLDADVVRTIGAQYQVQTYSDCHEFLAKADIEAVVIAVPDAWHVSLALDCLNAGKHVLVEKPLAQSAEEAGTLRSAIDGTKLKVLVGNMKRHDPGIQFAKDFIANRMGVLLSVNGWYCDTELRQQLQETLLLPPVKSSANGKKHPAAKADRKNYNLLTHGIHLVNTIQFLGGPIIRIAGKFVERFGSYSWHAVVEYAHGGIGHIELTTKIRSDWSEGFELHGEHGSVSGRTFLPFFKRASEVKTFDIRTGIIQTQVNPDGDAYKRQLDSFARSIIEEEPIACTIEDAILDLRAIEALKCSIEMSKWIDI